MDGANSNQIYPGHIIQSGTWDDLTLLNVIGIHNDVTPANRSVEIANNTTINGIFRLR
jgi:hypothetical protein